MSRLSLKDWAIWLRGLIGAGISGAANSISVGGVASWVAPEAFNMKVGESFHNLLWLTGLTALTAFIVSIAKYLSTKPIPEDLPES